MNGSSKLGLGSSSHHRVHVGFCPNDVVVVVDDHWSAENVQILHDVLLHISQCGDVCVIP